MWQYNYSDELYHGFKYIKRYKVNGKWRYVYGDEHVHKTAKRLEETRDQASEYASWARKTSRDAYDSYRAKVDFGTIKNHKKATDDYRSSKRLEGQYNDTASWYNDQLYEHVKNNSASTLNSIASEIEYGKKWLANLFKKKG